MFGSNHYVPILRWKQAERLALHKLQDADRARITPLIELTPTIFKAKKRDGIQGETPDPVKVLDEQAKHLLAACGYSHFFLDLCHISAKTVGKVRNSHPLDYLANRSRTCKLKLIPVTGLSRGKEYQAAVAKIVAEDGRGLCLRLTHDQILQEDSCRAIQDLLDSLSVNPDSVHLLVDFLASEPSQLDPRSLLLHIPNLNRWQTLSIAMGAFPPNLQQFVPGHHRIPRTDYLKWIDVVSQTAARKPAFADYTIQYGLYKEPPEGCNPSVSIRYTLDREWLIMRGEAVQGSEESRKKKSRDEVRPGREQWNFNAQLLCENGELFYGEDFSWGDEFIHERSITKDKHGTYEIWLRAGINHHMTVVSRQIANLSAA